MSIDKKRIVVIGEGSVSDLVRSFSNVRLFSDSYDVTIQNSSENGGRVALLECDIVVMSRPMNSDLTKAYRDMGAVVVSDQDDDFSAIPKSHVGYSAIGPGSGETLQDHLASLQMSDLLIVSTPELKYRFSSDLLIPEDRIVVIPNGWDNRNPAWTVSRQPGPQETRIGWGGTITHREDFKIAIGPLKQFTELIKASSVYIAGDPKIYNMLDWLPEKRKKFFPFVNYTNYPAFVRQCDVMLAPLVDDHFNRAKSDIKILEASAAQKPWIASPLPQYISWGAGGILANSPAQWLSAMISLSEDRDRNWMLTQEGHTQARSDRTFFSLSKTWEEAIDLALQRGQLEYPSSLRRYQRGVELQRVEGNEAAPSNKPHRRRKR